MVFVVLGVHFGDLLHVLKNGSSERRRLSEEQIIHVVHQELQRLVMKHGTLHVFKHLFESSSVLLHRRLRDKSPLVSGSFCSEADRDFELSKAVLVAEYVPEPSLRVKE